MDKLTHYTLFIASAAAIAGLLYGFELGIIGGAILFVQTEFSLSASQTSLIVAAPLFGAFLGAVSSAKLADRFGRTCLLFIGATIYIAGIIYTVAVSIDYELLLIGRLIIGFGLGVASFTAPLYLAEIAPPKHRGKIVAYYQLAITLGILLAQIMSYNLADEGLWRMMLITGIGPALVLLIASLFLPQSPRWLIYRGRLSYAQSVLRKIYQTRDVAMELNAIEANKNANDEMRWRSIVNPRLLPLLFIGAALGLFQQITGIGVVVSYAPMIFQSLDFEAETTGILATMGISGINVFFTIIAIYLIDRLGRRVLLFTGLSAMLVALLTLTVAFLPGEHTLSYHLPIVVVVAFFVYMAGFAFGLGVCLWVVATEIFPLHMRGTGTGLSISVMWLSHGIVAVSFLYSVDAITKSGISFLYAAITVAAILFVYFFVPETKQITLEDIQANLRACKPTRHLGDTPTASPLNPLDNDA